MPLIDARKWVWNIKSMTINYDGGLTGSMLVSKAFPYITQVEVPAGETYLWAAVNGPSFDPETSEDIYSHWLFKFDLAGNVIDNFSIREHITNDSGDYSSTRGPAWDGTHLITYGGNEIIYFIDPATRSVVRTLNDPWEVTLDSGITYDGQHLWVVSYDGVNRVLRRIDINTGQTLHTSPFPFDPVGEVLSLSWFNDRIWYRQHNGSIDELKSVDPYVGESSIQIEMQLAPSLSIFQRWCVAWKPDSSGLFMGGPPNNLYMYDLDDSGIVQDSFQSPYYVADNDSTGQFYDFVFIQEDGGF